MTQWVFLAQTDTTVGFLSQDAAKLRAIKQRQSHKPFLKVYPSLQAFKTDHSHIPNRYKSMLRRTKKCTFISKGRAFRIVYDAEHNRLLKRFRFMYSTSANQSTHRYDKEFCIRNSDIIVQDSRGLTEESPSRIVQLGKKKRRKLR
ncbi:MAG: hypothetical protein DSZ03_03465 [Sulfurimonas sp.]|nr:MAG: hypothetical protein DSZ03_03465 [Sulfurimonas sp.]